MDENKVEKTVDAADDAAAAVEEKADETVTEAAAETAEKAGEAVAETAEKAEEAVAETAEKADKPVRKAGAYADPIKLMTESSMRAERENIRIGDTVKVHVRIKEGDRERIQLFEGAVIAMKHGGVSETFTVRRTSYGVGVERVFPINSPNVEKVEIVRHGKTRRAKLYYLRDRVGKAAKLKQKLN